MAFPTKVVTQLYGSIGSSDRSIRLYNPSRPSPPPITNPLEPPKATQLIQTYSAHGYEVLDITVARDNATFASVGGDRSVFYWDPIMLLDEAGDSISCVLAGNGEGNGKGGEYEVLSGSVDGRVRTYDVRMGKVETDVVGTSVTSLARTRDGKGVLVGGLDSSIRLMDRDTGADGQVVVWDTLTGNVEEKITVEGAKAEGKKKIGRDGKVKDRQNVVSCVAWKQEGRGNQWCCGGTDGVVTVFGVA
ncbi:putative WD repeat domain-containing protein 83 [Glarea lozoyensis 74030]|uniref:Putative WD repeat domain-containing protein 83 n=1 Tax=Glarea lozoyensis (strain ATCC 74030 / MF5533) TaxID=1104152 RepID=H0EJ10_GLAL7|nr:putative WD repeat domain-containing protein 83 [Glarea lozoyensis 74030]